MEQDLAESLRELPVDGFIRFSIKAPNTEKNKVVHDGFKAFAAVECNNDYTLSLETLLRYWQDEAKIESLWENIRALRIELDELKLLVQDKVHKPEPVKEEDGGAF